MIPAFSHTGSRSMTTIPCDLNHTNCNHVIFHPESSEASVDGPEDNGEEEEQFDWPATPPDDLEIDTSELFGEVTRNILSSRKAIGDLLAFFNPNSESLP